MNRYALSRPSRRALLVTFVLCLMLFLLSCLSEYMIAAGSRPLQYAILTQQLRRLIPKLFLSGLPPVLLIDIAAKR